MFTEDVIREITAAADGAGLEPAALLAIAWVESAGNVFAFVDGRREPLIRFEGHYFDRRLSAEKRASARDAGLASPVAGAVANPAAQAGRWRMLGRAVAIDAQAAYESTSWGLGQVMGAHWARLGYASVEALVGEARSGAAGQARLMTRYIDRDGLAEALRAHDWEAFARGYNGPAYKHNAYDTKIAAAYRHYATGEPMAETAAPQALLRRGSRGEAVADLQRCLSARGYPLSGDGIFGHATEAAVMRFQSAQGLAVDGIAGLKTMAALRDTLASANPLTRAWALLVSWAQNLFGRI